MGQLQRHDGGVCAQHMRINADLKHSTVLLVPRFSHYWLWLDASVGDDVKFKTW